MSKQVFLPFSWLVLFIFFGFLLVNSLQDLIEAGRRGFHFYPSESLLFGSFFLWFIPGLGILHWVFQKKGRKGLILLSPIIFIGHLFLYALGIRIISGLFFEAAYGFQKNLLYGLSNYIIYGLIIYACWVVYLFQKYPSQRKLTPNIIPIKLGHQTILLPLDEIIYIKSEKPYIRIFTKDRNYLASLSLKEIMEDFDNENLLRIHRSTIVNVKFLYSFQSRKNGDYDIQMSEGSLLRLSRHYAAPIKAYFKSTAT